MKFFNRLIEKVISGKSITRAEASKFLETGVEDIHKVLFTACEIKKHFVGNKVDICSIINVKSGLCGEDCKYCAQSARHKTGIATYELKEPETMINEIKNDTDISERMGLVTSGKKLSRTEVSKIAEAVRSYKKNRIKKIPCASLGLLSYEDLLELKKAGLSRYHHNLETSRSFYSKICTTHSYGQRMETINAAKKAGLELCVGGIFGLGESVNDRIDFLFEVKEADPCSVPINFLIPIKGTVLQDLPVIEFFEAVKLIALTRLMLPDKVIKIGAGRVEIFKDAQDIIYLAGANAIISGNLLTVKGREPADDMRLIKQLGLKP